MPKYIIEREIPGAGSMTTKELQEASQKSCDVLLNLGPEIQWNHSYVTADKIYCVYHASDESLIRKHAGESGFPASRVSKVNAMIDPASADG